MAVTETAPFLALVTVAVLTAGVLLDGTDNPAGLAGALPPRGRPRPACASVAAQPSCRSRTPTPGGRKRATDQRPGGARGPPRCRPRQAWWRSTGSSTPRVSRSTWCAPRSDRRPRPCSCTCTAVAGPTATRSAARTMYHGSRSTGGWCWRSGTRSRRTSRSNSRSTPCDRGALGSTRVVRPRHSGDVGGARGRLGGWSSRDARGVHPGHDDERVDACVGLYAIYDMANRNRTRAHCGRRCRTW